MKQWLQYQTTTQGQPFFHRTFVEPQTPPPGPRQLRREIPPAYLLRVLDDERTNELAGKEWLVGGKCSAAYLSYVPFHSKLDFHHEGCGAGAGYGGGVFRMWMLGLRG